MTTLVINSIATTQNRCLIKYLNSRIQIAHTIICNYLIVSCLSLASLDTREACHTDFMRQNTQNCRWKQTDILKAWNIKTLVVDVLEGGIFNGLKYVENLNGLDDTAAHSEWLKVVIAVCATVFSSTFVTIIKIRIVLLEQSFNRYPTKLVNYILSTFTWYILYNTIDAWCSWHLMNKQIYIFSKR